MTFDDLSSLLSSTPYPVSSPSPSLPSLPFHLLLLPLPSSSVAPPPPPSPSSFLPGAGINAHNYTAGWLQAVNTASSSSSSFAGGGGERAGEGGENGEREGEEGREGKGQTQQQQQPEQPVLTHQSQPQPVFPSQNVDDYSARILATLQAQEGEEGRREDGEEGKKGGGEEGTYVTPVAEHKQGGKEEEEQDESRRKEVNAGTYPFFLLIRFFLRLVR